MECGASRFFLFENDGVWLDFDAAYVMIVDGNCVSWTNEQEGTEWTNYVIRLAGTRSRE